jgi:hypothetical protein
MQAKLNIEFSDLKLWVMNFLIKHFKLPMIGAEQSMILLIRSEE